MDAKKVWFSLFYCLLLTFAKVSGFRRNLSEITYRYTNCGSTNHEGPRANRDCASFYREAESPIITTQTFFSFGEDYGGAQGFRLPKNGLYNITIAGARGGEGVCNYHYGLGHVQRLQAQLTTDYEYLIMVGHRGTSVCQVEENAGISVCQEPRPTNLEEAQICNDMWFDYTNTSENEFNFAYAFNGGGGGGGASMIWPRNVTTKKFTRLLLVVAPGGGGASAVLDYDSMALRVASVGFPINSTDPMTVYNFHINAHFSRYFLGWPEGVRGTRPDGPTAITSGSGGGWDSTILLLSLEAIDGKLLSQPNNFAEGGSDCSSTLETLNAHVFSGVFGGYGGGGGGCGSGGGGGGYTGGHVPTNNNFMPGGGGDFGIFDDTFSVTILDDSLNDGDGYVEIVASNCECAGQCEVFTEEGQFECSCPNGTLLAEDGSSCYQEINVSFEAVSPLTFTASGETVYLTGLQLNSSLNIFGLDVTLSVTPPQDSGDVATEDLACALVFMTSDAAFNAILASNPVRSESGRAHRLTRLVGNETIGVEPNSDYVTFLQSPQLVTGAFLVSNGNCSLISRLKVNISSLSNSSPVTNFSVFEMLDVDVIIVSAESILAKDGTPSSTTASTQAPTTTTPPISITSSNDSNTGLIIGLVIVGSVLLVALAGIVAVLLYIKYTPARKRTVTIILSGESSGNLVQPTSIAETISFQLKENSAYTGDGHVSEDITTNVTSFQQLQMTVEDKQRYKKIFSSFLIARNSIIVGNEIGRGAFGVVFQGIIKKQMEDDENSSFEVAIKKIGNLGSQSELQAFLDESSIMITFKHTNILSIVGVCFDSPDHDGVPLLLLPFMANGSLKDYLKKKRAHLTDFDTMPDGLSVAILVRMCMDIADGLEYLASERFVHRDLAARNCMVDQTLVVRVGDFGLTRDIYTNDYYQAHQGTKVPVKWMAPEALNDRISNEKTDVWSFGVTCWEVFSLGRSPYPGVDNHELIDYITVQNKRLTKPTLCPQLMFDIALSVCWKLLPEERPTFESLTQQLKKYWSENMYEIYV